MKKLLSIALTAGILLSTLTACGGADSAGSEYRKTYGGELTTMNYLITGSENEYTVAANCVDTLVEYDKYGVVKPALAETWETSEDGLTWTFHLRKDAKWYTYDNQEYAPVTANDFVSAAKYLLTPDNASEINYIFTSIVQNAAEYFDGSVTDFTQVGVKALDNYTLQYTLKAPTPYFLSVLVHSSFMPANEKFIEEVGSKNFGMDNTKLLYNGAYIMTNFEPQKEHLFTKNENYRDKDNIFISTITETYNKDFSTLGPELFKRGETDFANLSADLKTAWENDASTKDMVAPSRNTYFTYFYAFNFDPKFDAEYEPENWKLAVNNENFRKAIQSGLDRKKEISVANPGQAESIMLNTITPKNFVDSKGTDYTEIGALKDITARDSFNEASAKEYAAKAKTELAAKGATFPIKILMPYNPNNSSDVNWDKETQVVEQQLEALLGKDFIDIIPEAGPSTGFLSQVRTAGKFALMKCNWGPDYADPETYTDPFTPESGNYNHPEKAEGYAETDGTKTYTKLLETAKAERTDLTKRYEAFANAEAFLINNAFVIPSYVSNPGFRATRLNELDAPYSPFGVSVLTYKGQKVLEKPLSKDEFNKAYETWLKERADALAKAEQ